jgi:poly-gamma-glutamate synthesis protein (capsule biosynthesis protein)
VPGWKTSLIFAGATALAGLAAGAFALGRVPALASLAAPTVLPPPPVRIAAALETASLDKPTNLVRANAPATTLRLQFGGDVLPHRPMLVTAEQIAQALAPLTPLFARADATVVNYETATGDPALVEDRALTYAAKPDWMAALASSGIDAVTVANNHACDLGIPGIDATMATAKRTNMLALGAADEDADTDAWRAHVIASKDGHGVCAVAWTALMNDESSSCARSGKLAEANASSAGRARIATAIAAAKREPGCDAVVAIFHGGLEYKAMGTEPRTQARVAAEAGADLVVMHHPHVASPIEVLHTKDGRNVPLFASLGNLVTNQGESWRMPFFPSDADSHRVCMNAWTRLGVIADVVFRWDAANRLEVAYGYHLVWTDNEHAENHDTRSPRISARLIDPTTDAELLARLDDDPRGPVALFANAHWMERPARRPSTGAPGVRQPHPVDHVWSRNAVEARSK